MATTGDTVLLEINESAATITLNRPDVLNSFNAAMAGELQGHLEHVRHDSAVRAVLLTGAGRAFCAGQDLADVVPDGDNDLRLGEIVKQCYNPIVSLLRGIEKPIVCAVNGVAAGAGANIALACDLIVASEKASFIQSFSKVGLVPDSGGTYTLPRLVGYQKAKEMMFLGERIGATAAHELGVVMTVLPQEELMTEARALCARLAAMPTLGLGLTKRALNLSGSNTFAEQIALEAELQQIAGTSEDYAEGVDAFINKRAPRYVGK